MADEFTGPNDILLALIHKGFPDITVTQVSEGDPYTVTICTRVVVVDDVLDQETVVAAFDADGNLMRDSAGNQLYTQQRTYRKVEREELHSTKFTATAPEYFDALLALYEQVK